MLRLEPYVYMTYSYLNIVSRVFYVYKREARRQKNQIIQTLKINRDQILCNLFSRQVKEFKFRKFSALSYVNHVLK